VEKLTPFYEILRKIDKNGRFYVDVNCQQICKISRKSENIPKSFKGATFFKHPVDSSVGS